MRIIKVLKADLISQKMGIIFIEVCGYFVAY